jgi:cytoskeletal protein CcmA (bactofilin family)
MNLQNIARMSKTTIAETPSVNIIGNGTDIIGDINSNGDFRIDGMLKGTIKSAGKVVVGSTGKVEGEIICQNADISGEVKAHLKVYELLSLKASAVVSGDIMTNKLAIEPGAVFTGACSMGNQETADEKPIYKAEAVPA